MENELTKLEYFACEFMKVYLAQKPPSDRNFEEAIQMAAIAAIDSAQTLIRELKYHPATSA